MPAQDGHGGAHPAPELVRKRTIFSISAKIEDPATNLYLETKGDYISAPVWIDAFA